MSTSLILNSGLLIVLAILNTNLLEAISIAGAKPDLVLIVLVYYGYRNGSMPAQVSGFAVGLVEDFLSAAPFGFHALFRTVMGFLSGLTHNKLFLDPILLPIAFVLVATLVKGLLVALVGAVFGVTEVFPALFGATFFTEAGYNAVLAPIVFAILRHVRPLHIVERSGTL